MIIKLYCIADVSGYGTWGKKKQLIIEKSVFDFDNEEDRETAEAYLDGAPLTEANFEEGCRTFLHDQDIDWGQRGVPYILIGEEQMRMLKLDTTLQKDSISKFLVTIDAMSEGDIRKIMGKEYIDTPGNFAAERYDYENVEDYMQSNMGSEQYAALLKWHTDNPAKVLKLLKKFAPIFAANEF